MFFSRNQLISKHTRFSPNGKKKKERMRQRVFQQDVALTSSSTTQSSTISKPIIEKQASKDRLDSHSFSSILSLFTSKPLYKYSEIPGLFKFNSIQFNSIQFNFFFFLNFFKFWVFPFYFFFSFS